MKKLIFFLEMHILFIFFGQSCMFIAMDSKWSLTKDVKNDCLLESNYDKLGKINPILYILDQDQIYFIIEHNLNSETKLAKINLNYQLLQEKIKSEGLYVLMEDYSNNIEQDKKKNYRLSMNKKELKSIYNSHLLYKYLYPPPLFSHGIYRFLLLGKYPRRNAYFSYEGDKDFDNDLKDIAPKGILHRSVYKLPLEEVKIGMNLEVQLDGISQLYYFSSKEYLRFDSRGCKYF